ncbi:hypothetical protein D3C73_1416370 [compost metagenome]
MEHHPPVVNKHNIIGNSLKVSSVMGREQDRLLLILNMLTEQIQQLPAEHRIKTRCGFIHNQQLGAM